MLSFYLKRIVRSFVFFLMDLKPALKFIDCREI
uniref:Uncharacterized protein n=1 Tax=Rhizophora mucronata TaxID=61149 RepID=A0A2P2QWI7_RHIMU